MTLNVGDSAPTFSLPDGDGKTVNLSDFQGKWVVLYFYPRDNTPGCTKEACSFRDAYATYEAKDIAVLGVSMDDAKAHTKFSTKHNLPFPLLTDADGSMATAYESYGLKKFMGKEYMGIFRKTFLIAPDGTIAKIYPKVKPEGHAEVVRADLEVLMAR
ncbi:MAG: thioredoxin-dependent thiol peroxidase [Cyanobacteria bacterium J06638_20]